MAPKKDVKKTEKSETVDPDAVNIEEPHVVLPVAVQKIAGLRSLLRRDGQSEASCLSYWKYNK